jgi:hypothetical protein
VRDLDGVRRFRARHGDIILKPLYGNGGAAVFRLAAGDTNLGALVELFQGVFREPFMVQKYLPQVRAGDKRIILVDGEPAGVINRVPADDETRSNMHIGGRAEAISLTDRDREICTKIGPELRRRARQAIRLTSGRGGDRGLRRQNQVFERHALRAVDDSTGNEELDCVRIRELVGDAPQNGGFSATRSSGEYDGVLAERSRRDDLFETPASDRIDLEKITEYWKTVHETSETLFLSCVGSDAGSQGLFPFHQTCDLAVRLSPGMGRIRRYGIAMS